jgi:hypothetical protein
MSRRKIVVEGTQFAWALSGNNVVVFPPKGGGGPILEPLPNPDPHDWDDREARACVTPGIVAGIIYRRILKRERPVRAPSPQAAHGKPKAVVPTARWTAAPAAPRAYLVEASWNAGEGAVSEVVEVHLDASGAKRRVDALNAVLSMRSPPTSVRGATRVRLSDGTAADVELCDVAAVRRLAHGADVKVSARVAPTRELAAA